MKLSEFKAWFEGFTEDMDGAPSEKQWKRIKEQVAAVDGVAITYPVYVDRYIRPYPYDRYPYWVDYGVGSMTAQSTGVSYNAADYKRDFDAKNHTAEFDSHRAMYLAGKADAAH